MWIWVSGSDTIDQAGVYGTKGLAAAAIFPGAREASVSWTDSSGNLWLFGGSNGEELYASLLNDLWRYDTGTNMWTWVSGSDQINQSGVYGTLGLPDVANIPGARVSNVSWIEDSGKFWLYGGFGYNEGSSSILLGDLWRYDPVTNEWTWLNGLRRYWRGPTYGSKGVPSATSYPGARIGSISWADSSGKLWLFGGLTEYWGWPCGCPS